MIGIIRNRKTFSSAPLAGVLDFLAGERLVNLTGNLARNVLVPAAAILVFCCCGLPVPARYRPRSAYCPAPTRYGAGRCPLRRAP